MVNVERIQHQTFLIRRMTSVLSGPGKTLSNLHFEVFGKVC